MGISSNIGDENATSAVLYIEHGLSYGGALISLLETICYSSSTSVVVTFLPPEELPERKLPDHISIVRLHTFTSYRQRRVFLSWIREKVGSGLVHWLFRKGYALADFLNEYYLIWQLTKLIKHRRIDLIHCNNNITTLTARLAKAVSLPLVCHFRGADNYRSYPQHLREADAYISISKALTELYSAQLGLSPESFISIMDPVDLLPFQLPDHKDAASKLRQQRDISDEALIVVMVGRVMHFKGQHLLLDAMIALMGKHSDLHLWFVGDSADFGSQYYDNLRSKADTSQVSGRITFWGYQPHVAPLILASDIVVNASVGIEGFGRSIVEGFAARKAVITSAIGGPLDLVTDGVTGLLVKPSSIESLRDALQRLIADAKLRQLLAENGHQFAIGKLRGEAVAAAIDAVHRGLLGKTLPNCTADEIGSVSEAYVSAPENDVELA